MDELNFGEMHSFATVVGIDGTSPKSQIMINLQEAVKGSIFTELEIKRENIYVRNQFVPADEEYREELGDRVIHVQQYDIGIPDEVSVSEQKLLEIVETKLTDMGFNVEESKIQRTDDKLKLGE